MPTIRLSYAEWGRAEHRAARRAWLGGTAPDAVAELRARLRGIAGDGVEVLALNAARTGIRLALEAFRERRPGRDAVVVPTFVCPAVPEAVLASHARPAPVAVGADLNLDPDALARRLDRGDVLAVIAAHMYAVPASIARIEALCRAAGVFLIDDAAQVVGITADGRELGTFGDVGVLSFAQSKTVVTGVGGSGGAILTRDAELFAALAQRAASLPIAAGARGRLLRFYRDYLGEHRTRTAVYYLKRLGLGPRPTDSYPMATIHPVEAAIAVAQLDSLHTRIAARRAHVARLTSALGPVPRLRVPQAASTYLTRVMLELPIDVPRATFRARLGAAGIQTRNGYDVRCLAPFADDGADLAIADRLVEIPIGCSDDDAVLQRSVAAIAAALGPAT